MKVIGTAEATAVIADYFDLICDTDYAFDESEILRRMNANAVDAVPVKRGKWTVTPIYIKCSECGESFMLIPQNYCPNCGADMRGEE